MLLAAGFGTRLRPLTCLLPKPMLPLCNKPLIGWIVEHAIAAGVNDFIVNTHHLPRAIEDYLPAAFANASFIFSLENDEILGTGGALRRVRPLLESDDDFFLANGDTIHEVVVHYETFARYSRDTGQQLSYYLLMGHAVAIAVSKL